MRPVPFGVRLAIAGAAAVALFSAVATWLVSTGRWPQLRPGALRDVDLWAGLVFLGAFVVSLMWRKRGPGTP